MKHLNNFKNHQKVNEEIGVGLALAGIASLFFSNAIAELATGMWNRAWLKLKFDIDKSRPESKQNQILKFEGYKDNEGKHHWGIDLTTSSGDEVTFIYDDEGFEKFKKKLKDEGLTNNNRYDLFGGSSKHSKWTGSTNDSF
jgi:hypothetical protein